MEFLLRKKKMRMRRRPKNFRTAGAIHNLHKTNPKLDSLSFRRSSAVEQLTVNQSVAGSRPAAGAKNQRSRNFRTAGAIPIRIFRTAGAILKKFLDWLRPS